MTDDNIGLLARQVGTEYVDEYDFSDFPIDQLEFQDEELKQQYMRDRSRTMFSKIRNSTRLGRHKLSKLLFLLATYHILTFIASIVVMHVYRDNNCDMYMSVWLIVSLFFTCLLSLLLVFVVKGSLAIGVSVILIMFMLIWSIFGIVFVALEKTCAEEQSEFRGLHIFTIIHCVSDLIYIVVSIFIASFTIGYYYEGEKRIPYMSSILEKFTDDVTEEEEYYRSSVVEFSKQGNFHGAKPGNYQPEVRKYKSDEAILSNMLSSYPIDEIVDGNTRFPITRSFDQSLREVQSNNDSDDDFIYQENAVLDHIHPAVEEYYIRKRKVK